MNILKIADVPPAEVTAFTSVLEAIQVMVRHRVGAVAVTHDHRLSGVFSERDVMVRVVLGRRDPSTTPVSEVMTSPVETVTTDISQGEALARMIEHHIRHLPIVDENQRVLGMLSLRNLLHNRVEDLGRELDSLENYLTADGPGG